jgi:DNA-binding transcriptional ArsR family regulator
LPNTTDARERGATGRDLDRVIGALRSPIRRDILGLIWQRELPAGEIAAAFSVTKPTISQHLAVLRDAGLVTMTVAGTSRRYRARPSALSGLHGALQGARKWSNADEAPERALAEAATKPAVVVSVEVPTDQPTTFRSFTDDAVYSRWLGAPVTITGTRFSATMEWGTEVRGSYEVVCAPELIAMRWDFEDDNVPVPGAGLVGYLRVTPRARGGARVEVHQLVDTPEQAAFMEMAWSTVLGRLRSGITAAIDPAMAMPRRARRRKRGGVS